MAEGASEGCTCQRRCDFTSFLFNGKSGSVFQCYPATNRRARNNFLGKPSSLLKALHTEMAVDGISMITDFTSDHEGADIWLVVLACCQSFHKRCNKGPISFL